MDNKDNWVIVIIAVLMFFLFGNIYGGMMGYGNFGMGMGGMMNYMAGYGWGFGWIFGAIFMLLVFVILILLILWLIKQLEVKK